MKKIILTILITLGIGILIGFIFGLPIWIMHERDKICNSNPKDKQCRGSERLICEDAGGLYYSGGFGASNCVFPPSLLKD